MFTGITSHGSALLASIVLLTGGAIVRDGAAAADPSQDEQFIALLAAEGIPAVEGMPTLISTAHKVCRVLDRGISVDTMVDAMLNNAYTQDPVERLYPRTRLTSTMTRFITASVEAYCPREQGKIATIMAQTAPASNRLWHSGPGWRKGPGGVLSLPHVKQTGAHGIALASSVRALPSGDMVPPSPPDIPPPPPAEHLRTPPRAIAVQPTPKRLPPLPERPPSPKQQPPPPQQLKPPTGAPRQGGPATGQGGTGGGDAGASGGGSGGGSTGGGGLVPASPMPPAQPMPPGFVRLAP
ncbi:DUF732 domain-containing protein [Mycobacterium seoulense]|uniref:DUF732 domain-containing protein n=1 Tax=Mycobacterium seoulense TaxID=386911 RepID=A0A7I7P4U4_9MYCO|nr:DUF732 domain-containing protein [Mycobacterium seoulense]MCV7438501.1 DUF732 domain-containing protein [Mycobacterium seoulense]BBY03554.1 hypothetical protein MSEO_40530 [Mycobacterium seoulense]